MRYHKGDSWGRGSYRIPQFAVVGCSYTGEWTDSPAPRKAIEPELKQLRNALRMQGISSRYQSTSTGNAFCIKVWVTVTGNTFQRALDIATKWLSEHEADTKHIHDAA